MLVWIYKFNRVRSTSFYDDKNVRTKTRSEMSKYMGIVMSTAYEGLYLDTNPVKESYFELCTELLEQV